MTRDEITDLAESLDEPSRLAIAFLLDRIDRLESELERLKDVVCDGDADYIDEAMRWD